MTAPGLRVAGSAWLGEVPLFEGLDFRAEAAGWTCILGPSGVGKSTLIRLIAGLDTGARFEGEVAATDGAPLGGRVAWMAQQDELLPWLSVAQNAGLGARLRGGRADSAAVAALLARAGLSAQSARRPAQLSGGQRQRVALARTLMEDRPVVLLDEPFSALDAKTRAEMQDLAFEMLAGRTVVLVTHDPGEAARLGSRIWLMGPGGLGEVEVPAAPAIRSVDDPGCLKVQGELLRRMRAAA
ncbi:ABC transporter ATP-binding protein [Poseidonocella sp. HB161398]|uniref:ABC transporter ATP-binding protein n=1 Tax=Poseidonocella sp. HB161398 TaxID=2320855 RepID=UPI00110947C2|nr:ATP-binding cassette domain-containing protein [Poseidonocella sp. HB161398]